MRTSLFCAFLTAVIAAASACSSSTTPATPTTTTTTTTTTTVAVPVVTSINPNASDAGGAVVTITGSGFLNASVVTFGGTASTSYTAASDTTIVANAPDCTTPGTVDVVVTTPGGTSATSSADQFTCGKNSLTALSVNAFSVKGGAALVGTVTMAYTTAGSYTLPLTVSSNPANSAAVKVPANVVVNVGSKTGIFVITTSAVSSEQQIVITTHYQDSTQSATFYLEP